MRKCAKKTCSEGEVQACRSEINEETDRDWGLGKDFPEEMELGLKPAKWGGVNQGKKRKGVPDSRRPMGLRSRAGLAHPQRPRRWGPPRRARSPTPPGLVSHELSELSAAFKPGPAGGAGWSRDPLAAGKRGGARAWGREWGRAQAGGCSAQAWPPSCAEAPSVWRY